MFGLYWLGFGWVGLGVIWLRWDRFVDQLIWLNCFGLCLVGPRCVVLRNNELFKIRTKLLPCIKNLETLMANNWPFFPEEFLKRV